MLLYVLIMAPVDLELLLLLLNQVSSLNNNVRCIKYMKDTSYGLAVTINNGSGPPFVAKQYSRRKHLCPEMIPKTAELLFEFRETVFFF